MSAQFRTDPSLAAPAAAASPPARLLLRDEFIAGPFWPAVALITVFTLSWEIYAVIVAIVEDRFGAWLAKLGKEWISYMLVGMSMYVPIVGVSRHGPRSGWRRVIALGSALAVATPIASFVRSAWMHWFWGQSVDWSSVVFSRTTTRFGVVAGLLIVVSEFYRREQESLAAMHRAELDRVNLERQMAQARVRVLQAQVEPHFLFNTLANVRRLYETDRAAGHRMLDNLMRYFEAALPRMRDAVSTLGGEAALIESYLNVQQIRMGRRLAFRIDIPKALDAFEVPPMMMLTLVENAIKHGVNPLPAGGRIDVVARDVAGRIEIEVSDTGRGLAASSGGGTGLANIRARLEAMYGGEASLLIAGNPPQGITARLLLPGRPPLRNPGSVEMDAGSRQ